MLALTPSRAFLAIARRYRWHLAIGLLVLQLGSACPTPDITNVTGGGGGASAPGAPSTLAATPSSATQINLSWTDNSTNEDGFRIERAPGGTTTFAEIGTVATGVTTYQSTGLTGSTAYSYRVRAYNATGNSAYTSAADATTMLAPPAAPSNLTALGASSSQVNVSWTDNSNNEDGFRIEVTTTGASGFSEITTVGAGVTTYQHTGLAPSTGYTYRVRSYNAAGTSIYSNSGVGFTAATPVIPPAAPSGLAATGVGPNTISLSWTDNSDNESGFRIERAPGGTTSFVEIVAVNAGQTTYLNAGLTVGTQYAYRIRAYNSAGTSAYTTTATATTTGGGSPPVAPSALGATAASSTQINLTWTDNSSNEDGFKVERAPGTTVTFTEIASVGAGVTTYQNTGLTASTQFTYRVRAYNSIGTSAYSATATATTTAAPPNPPAAPSGLGATAASASQINLAWTDNSSDEDGFRIERAPGTTTTFTEIATVGAGVTTYQNTSLPASTQYTYRVRAYNAAGNSAYSATATATTSAGASPPAAPSGLGAAAASSAQINLTWTDNSNNENGFRIEQCTGVSCGSFAEIATVGAGVDNYQSTGLTEGTTYGFRVRAYNGAGNSAYSNTASAPTETPLPTLPTNLGATATSASQINLTWNDNSTNETGFRIERCTGAACSSFAEIATVGAGVVAYQNTGLGASTLYRYRVRAYNLGGNSAYSDPAEATTQGGLTLPAAPSGLGATAASNTQINLAWTDNSNNEDGFRIESCSGPSCSGFVEITTVGAGVTTYQNASLAANTPYSYRVRAYNAAGNSGYTATATATTLVAPPVAPSGLTASVISDVQINLAWTDNSSNETGFRIEASVSGGAFGEVGTVGAGVNNQQIVGLTSGVTYSFRVRAYNAGGTSGYSNSASGTTWLVFFATAASATQAFFVEGVNDNTYANIPYPTGKIGVGCNVVLATGPGQTSTAGCTESALQFTGLVSAVGGRPISAAYLRISPSDLAGNFQSVYGAYSFNGSWNPSSITFNNKPGVTATSPGLYAPPNSGTPIDFTVTAHVQAWISGTTNNGFLVTPTSTPGGSVVGTTYFWSDDTYNSQIYLRPLLIVVFQ